MHTKCYDIVVRPRLFNYEFAELAKFIIMESCLQNFTVHRTKLAADVAICNA